MKNFYLKKLDKDGRIIIDDNKRGGEVLETYKAESWLDARTQVNELFYEHRSGYGYYL